MFDKKYVDKKKSEIDRELELYKREQTLAIREELAKCRDALKNDWSSMEHEYHSARQKKETEIAKLDALIEAKQDILKQDNEVCHFLKGIITDLSKMRVHNDINIDNIKS